MLPKTWDYLIIHKKYFDSRKSKIYKNSPLFSIFGIGVYSFKSFKVAISGFYKKALFCLLAGEKQIMLDDTCYYLSFDDYDDAYIVMLILNSKLVNEFLKSIVFLDSKRPYTKKLLKRIDIQQCLKILTINDLINVEEDLDLNHYINEDILDNFKNKYFNT